MLDMLEYREDLKYYWKDGYGYKINTEQACVLVKDAMDNFRNITMSGDTGKEEQNGIFYFTHSGTILKNYCYSAFIYFFYICFELILLPSLFFKLTLFLLFLAIIYISKALIIFFKFCFLKYIEKSAAFSKFSISLQ